MKKKSLLLLFILSTHFLFAQSEKSIFDIARTGTVSEITKIIKKEPKSVLSLNESGYSALVLATYRENNEVAKFLIENGSDINGNSNYGTPLMAAVVKGNNEIAKLLIEKKVDVNLADTEGTTALMYAVQFKNYELVSAMVKSNADINYKNKKGKSSIDYALLLDDDTLMELLNNTNKKL